MSSECLFSSFWAPLYDRKILNYRVDAKFDPDVGRNNRDEYQRKNGYRGEELIADLGKGKGPDNRSKKDYGEVKLYYTKK
ncbi:unnamed protein product [Parnassius apollo]|uniref:(apollo) hypothetical protein n=1 Tax=Parnassius apollo TaxID=110799 RepID=A0A8S3X362_PARAO|nr:unnamed protein product [Parnassius apollo]